MTTLERDVAVIGAGPVGLFTVFALGQLGLSTFVVDTLQEIGGQCAALYPDKPIYDIPSRPAVTGGGLIDELMKQAEPYAPLYILGKRVESIKDQAVGFELLLSDGMVVRAKSIVVAAGAGAFGPNRPPLEDLELYEGTSVFYSVRSPERFRGKKVVIAGGGDSAADWAVVLADIASSVTVVHRRQTFRAAPATLAALENLSAKGRITIAAPRSLLDIHGQNGHLSNVSVTDGNGVVESLDADALLCFFGLTKDLSAISNWDIDAQRNGIEVAPATMSTKRAGIYAVGDIADYPGKLKLILTGFAEAAIAAHAIRAFLHPADVFHFEYSTARGAPIAAGAQEVC